MLKYRISGKEKASYILLFSQFKKKSFGTMVILRDAVVIAIYSFFGVRRAVGTTETRTPQHLTSNLESSVLDNISHQQF